MVRSHAKPLNEEKKRRKMKNDILVRVCLPSSFSLATEHRKEEGKNERTKRQIEPWILFASHIFIQNDKAMSVE